VSGHRALITGASRGIGRGVAVALAGAGHAIAAAARSEDELAETVARAHEAGAPTAVSLPFDAARPPAALELAARATEALGGSPDILVHCAGIARNGPLGELSLADWNESLNVNVTSAFVLASELGPAMAAAGWGRIVTIGSLYSRFGVARTAAYTSTKHALLGLTRVMAAEWVKSGVTANLLAPGFVDTEMVQSQAAAAAEARGVSSDEIIKKFLRIQPLGRMVTTEEVGALVAFLCSDAGAPITGQAINIDGGAYQA
jgi:NAD(P)-dependent dehydrogenase (short-subunit alcohol dehydrogenase family)